MWYIFQRYRYEYGSRGLSFVGCCIWLCTLSRYERFRAFDRCKVWKIECTPQPRGKGEVITMLTFIARRGLCCEGLAGLHVAELEI